MKINKGVYVVFLILALAATSCQDTGMAKYLEWRELWFSVKPDEIGLDLDPSSTIPFAVIMDIGFDDGNVSIWSSIIGDTSLVTSAGGGIFGAGQEDESCRNASIQFVEMSANFVYKMEPATEYPLPSTDNVIFYVITPSGIFTAPEVDVNILWSGDHELSPLFIKGDNVITAIREADESRSGTQGP